jgi:hypothetical protein
VEDIDDESDFENVASNTRWKASPNPRGLTSSKPKLFLEEQPGSVGHLSIAHRA